MNKFHSHQPVTFSPGRKKDLLQRLRETVLGAFKNSSVRPKETSTSLTETGSWLRGCLVNNSILLLFHFLFEKKVPYAVLLEAQWDAFLISVSRDSLIQTEHAPRRRSSMQLQSRQCLFFRTAPIAIVEVINHVDNMQSLDDIVESNCARTKMSCLGAWRQLDSFALFSHIPAP